VTVVFQLDMTLKMWKKGFSVDDGELRLYEDPANREFLDSISRG
jgi:UBX domain-containing protein 1